MPCSSSGCLGQVVNNPEICVTSDRGDEVKVLLQANNATGLVVTKLNLLHYVLVIQKYKSNKMLQKNLTPFFSSVFIALSDAVLHFARCVAP